MKFIVVLALFVAVAVAAPAQQQQPEVSIITQEAEIDPQGNYHNNVELSDGSKVNAEGNLKANPNPEEPAFITSKGSYEYQSPEGELIHVDWYADENGFHAEGNHLPVAAVA